MNSISKGFPLNILFDFDLLQPLKLTINFANVKKENYSSVRGFSTTSIHFWYLKVAQNIITCCHCYPYSYTCHPKPAKCNLLTVNIYNCGWWRAGHCDPRRLLWLASCDSDRLPRNVGWRGNYCHVSPPLLYNSK